MQYDCAGTYQHPILYAVNAIYNIIYIKDLNVHKPSASFLIYPPAPTALR